MFGAHLQEFIIPCEQGIDQLIEHVLGRLTEEVGELARVLMHRYGGKKPKPGEDPGDAGEEIADAIFVLVCLANSLEINLDEKFSEMMAKYRKRDAERWTRK